MRQLEFNGKAYYYHGKVMIKEKNNSGKEIAISKLMIESVDTGIVDTIYIDTNVKFIS